MQKAMIFDIQNGSTVDGPGIRTTVFFKGCHLRCRWCHNPESQLPQAQILFDPTRCAGCGRCRGITPKSTDFLCFYGAKRICGKEYTVDGLFEIIARDKAFYRNSGGGVTFSGGECMLYPDFLAEILKRCRANGIHTAVDTAGFVPWKSFAQVLPDTDLFLYDIKTIRNELHQKYTGAPNREILDNLKKLFEAGAGIYIRIPVIPGVNDSTEEMQQIKQFLLPYHPQKIELLPYHRMGEHKYRMLNLPLTSFDVPSEEKISGLKQVFES